jgi:hypothetical protein
MRSTSTSSVRTFATPPVNETPQPPQKPKREFQLPKINYVTTFMIVLILLCIFLFLEYRAARRTLTSPSTSTAASNKQVNSVIEEVGKLVILPTGETPTVATVAQADKLRSQSFFANAQNGDKVLVYSQHKEAILYRPSDNKIVLIAPVTVSNNTEQ